MLTLELIFVVRTSPDISNSNVARVTKKVRKRTKFPSCSDDPTVDGVGRKVPEGSLQKASYKHTLMGSEDDYNKVITNGPWVIFGQYLTIRLWTPNFSTTQDKVGIQVGRFIRIAICVDLRKPLISKVRINGHLQRVEYESLPHVCFKCCLYGHGV
ncbi:hypothetical protein Gotur_005598 [Gossypium turneri]